MGFLTIEDVNTNNLSIINEFYELDTSLLGDEDYSNKIYDFCKVTRFTVSDTITFDFKIVNSLWTGGFYVTDSDGEYIDVSENYTYDSTNNILSITIDEDIILHLYLCSFYREFKIGLLSWIQRDMDSLLPHNFNLDLINLKSDEESIEGCYVSDYYYVNDGKATPSYHKTDYGYMENRQGFYSDNGFIYDLYDSNNGNHIYLKYNYIKFPIFVNINTGCIYKGIINKIQLNINSTVFGGVIDGYVKFNNNIIPIYTENNSFYFDLDLIDYIHNHVELQVILNETQHNCSSKYSFNFNVDYMNITNESELLTMINESGIVKLADDITLSDDIIVTSPIKIIGNDNSIDLNNHSIILNSNINFKVENLLLDNGDTAIIQGKNTKVELDNVTFTNCVSTDYNNQGSCILCDIDINSLDSADDYITVLNDCTFINNHNCIVHGGELTITGCKYLNNDITYTDKNNVAFLYQVDGNANVNNCIFDINYTEDTYCTNQENIGFAQALLKIGETAQINSDSHKNYTNNISTFTNNNQCHLFVKYYYPKIESCVYSSPVIGKENKALCYSASGVNWVFKENIRVTRASNSNENTNPPFDW